MKSVTVPTVIGMFLGIFITLAGFAKLFQTITVTFVPDYAHVYHQHSGELHFGFFLASAGLTTIWSLRRR
jgi:hypothetical protein